MRYISAFIFTSLAFMGQANAFEELPVELFAAHSEYKNLQLSPDGKHIAFTYEEKDNEVKLGIISSDMKKITAGFGRGKDKHVVGQFWVNNNRLIMSIVKNTGTFVKSSFGGFVVGINVDGKKRRRLFDDNRRSGFRIINRLWSDPENILVAKSHFTEKGGITINKLNVNNGKLKYLAVLPNASGRGRIVSVGIDNNEQVRLAFENDTGENKYDSDDDILTVHYKLAGGWAKQKLPSVRPVSTFNSLGFGPDNKKFYFLSNFDMAKNATQGVFSFDFETQQIKLEFRHPDVDVLGAIRGPKREVLGVIYEPGYPEKHYFDNTNKETQFLQSLSASFKGQNVTVTSYTKDGQSAIVFVRSDRNPGDFYLFSKETGKLRYLASTFPKIHSKQMSHVEAFTMQARDGVKLYGFITLPKDKPAKNLPLIVIPHGGPHGPFDRWGYRGEDQLFANRGYAVLHINFRGSGGYGQDFLESGYGKWGREMQDDVTDATLWAVKEGIADKQRICIYGGSYGGYATLQGLVREPDLYKCGVGIAGVYSLPMMWTGDSDMREARSSYYSDVFLNKFIGKDPEELRAYSPAFHVDKIKAAIFLIHGTRDRRVPLSHAELVRKNLDKIGKKYEWLVRDEGHGFTQEKNRFDQYHQVLAFFKKYIGD